MNRRDFLGWTALGTAQAMLRPVLPRPSEIEEATIGDLQEAMKAGKETAASLAEKHLKRIADVDKGGPEIGRAHV